MNLKREVVLHVKSDREAMEVLRAIRKHLRPFNAYVRYEKGKIRLTIYGSKDHVRIALNEIKSIYRKIKNALYKNKDGMYQYDASLIAEKSQVTVSIKDLGKILELKGYKGNVQDTLLRTDVELEEVINLARKYRKLIDEIQDVGPKIIRKILCMATIITGMDHKNLLKVAISKGLIKYLGNNRYGLVATPDETCKKLIKEALSGENKNFRNK
ncbi:MAG: DUF2067 family protein [Candidatus Baldrarchaeia archaeon]